MLALQIENPVRNIVYRTRGRARGPITRLVSPSDLGELIKPFVFLDLAVFEGNERMPMEQFWHPHSGIATVTVILDGAIRIVDTAGADEVLPAGSIEWMRAGNGVWHTGQAEPGHVKGFQLWVALPPELENGPSQSHYVMPGDVPTDGRVRVILGTYDGMTSPIAAPPRMTYLVVSLKDGERWTFTPPKGHDVAWVAVGDGSLRTARARLGSGEVAIFDEGPAPIELIADGSTRFVIGSARKHPHDLVLGYYSVHTSAEALRKGEAEIERIGSELLANGTLKR
jgi:redox-sensitive bicupin YhaK (pirin superfamily)